MKAVVTAGAHRPMSGIPLSISVHERTIAFGATGERIRLPLGSRSSTPLHVKVTELLTGSSTSITHTPEQSAPLRSRIGSSLARFAAHKHV